MSDVFLQSANCQLPISNDQFFVLYFFYRIKWNSIKNRSIAGRLFMSVNSFRVKSLIIPRSHRAHEILQLDIFECTGFGLFRAAQRSSQRLALGRQTGWSPWTPLRSTKCQSPCPQNISREKTLWALWLRGIFKEMYDKEHVWLETVPVIHWKQITSKLRFAPSKFWFSKFYFIELIFWERSVIFW